MTDTHNRHFMFSVCVYLSLNVGLCQGNTATDGSLKLWSLETFVMLGPQVINELATTSVVWKLCGEKIKIHRYLDTGFLHISLCDSSEHKVTFALHIYSKFPFLSLRPGFFKLEQTLKQHFCKIKKKITAERAQTCSFMERIFWLDIQCAIFTAVCALWIFRQVK